MKIGDTIRVLETGRIGIIIGETANGWKIDFTDGYKPELVDKNVPMEVVEVKPNPNPSPNPRPKKRWGWQRWLWTIGAILFIGFALYLTIKGSM